MPIGIHTFWFCSYSAAYTNAEERCLMAVETIMRTYTSAKEFERDRAKLANDGWTVLSTTEHRPRQGCLRIILLAFIFAFMFPPKPQIVVTYQRSLPD